MKKFKIKFSYISLLVLIILTLTNNIIHWSYICAVTVHELGHIFVAILFKINIKELKLNIFGARLNISEKLYSYRDEFLLCAFGPLFNYTSALLIYILTTNTDANEFILSSVILGTLNLLPINGFDGGRMLKCLLLSFLPQNIARYIINTTSFIIITLLWLISVYFLLIYSTSLGIFVFSSSLFFSIFLKKDIDVN